MFFYPRAKSDAIKGDTTSANGSEGGSGGKQSLQKKKDSQVGAVGELLQILLRVSESWDLESRDRK